MIWLAVEDVTETARDNPELVWIAGAVVVVILIALIIAALSRGRSRPTTSREDLVERAARAEAERDALRDENQRLREDLDRARDGAVPRDRSRATDGGHTTERSEDHRID
jgi:flagellar biosynthesis/type III secretory pathway M-ring protein FliF/YscJ